jgi:hypothetical protein
MSEFDDMEWLLYAHITAPHYCFTLQIKEIAACRTQSKRLRFVEWQLYAQLSHVHARTCAAATR